MPSLAGVLSVMRIAKCQLCMFSLCYFVFYVSSSDHSRRSNEGHPGLLQADSWYHLIYSFLASYMSSPKDDTLLCFCASLDARVSTMTRCCF